MFGISDKSHFTSMVALVFGLKNCHYALVTIDEDGKVTFGTPVSMPGSVSLSLDAEGDNDPFYADDSVY